MEFFAEVFGKIMGNSGFAYLPQDWRQVVMILVACVLLYLGIGRGFEPLLLVPIAFGMLLANLPLTGLFDAPQGTTVGFMWVLYRGVEYAIYPSIIFMGIGAMTDFGPLLANPMSLLLGAAAQLYPFFQMGFILGSEVQFPHLLDNLAHLTAAGFPVLLLGQQFFVFFGELQIIMISLPVIFHGKISLGIVV